jgi:hypothetical protein
VDAARKRPHIVRFMREGLWIALAQLLLGVLLKGRKGERLISIPAAGARLTFVNTLGIASTDAARLLMGDV